MADCNMKKSVGIFYDVLAKVASSIFLADFMILDCEVDIEILII